LSSEEDSAKSGKEKCKNKSPLLLTKWWYTPLGHLNASLLRKSTGSKTIPSVMRRAAVRITTDNMG
jgi:hypothetical protein